MIDTPIPASGLELRTERLVTVFVAINPRLNFGNGPVGRRVLFNCAGGRFAGPRLRGEVLPGGGDWGLYGSDGAMIIDARLSLRTDDGALVNMSYGGRLIVPAAITSEMANAATRHHIDPAAYYLRTTPSFETGAEPYKWLNEIVCVGIGYVVEGGVAYEINLVL